MNREDGVRPALACSVGRRHAAAGRPSASDRGVTTAYATLRFDLMNREDGVHPSLTWPVGRRHAAAGRPSASDRGATTAYATLRFDLMNREDGAPALGRLAQGAVAQLVAGARVTGTEKARVRATTLYEDRMLRAPGRGVASARLTGTETTKARVRATTLHEDRMLPAPGRGVASARPTGTETTKARVRATTLHEDRMLPAPGRGWQVLARPGRRRRKRESAQQPYMRIVCFGRRCGRRMSAGTSKPSRGYRHSPA
jgi:hypothetical protein